MKFLVITNAPTLFNNNSHEAYAPYVTEMDIWSKYITEFTIISPTKYSGKLLVKPFIKQPNVISIPAIDFTTFKSIFTSLCYIPIICFKLFLACYKTDHIHLRCPGNIGLLACFVQILFPTKVKTAKYAGNWNPDAVQPLTYRIQKRILSNTFFTKKMTVLVYGKWKNQTKNIKAFFTATYYDNEKPVFVEKSFNSQLKFLFVGTLVKGKRPLLAIQTIEALQKKGINCSIDFFGDGILREELQNYIDNHNLKKVVLHGNQTKETLKKYLSESHFSILASKSEGWPKAVAEAMFYGVIPIATKISCVPYMLGEGERGILIEPDLELATKQILKNLCDADKLASMSKKAQEWSQTYTLDYFESEIQKLIVN